MPTSMRDTTSLLAHTCQVTCDRYCIPDERLLNVCAHCKAADRLLAKDEAAVASCNSDTKMVCTLPTYNYSLEMLSPASQKAWMRRIMKDRKNLNGKVDKYSKLCISLNDKQDSELTAVVSTINKNQSMRSELRRYFLKQIITKIMEVHKTSGNWIQHIKSSLRISNGTVSCMYE